MTAICSKYAKKDRNFSIGLMSNRNDKAAALENLKHQIEEWRDSGADKLGMAPAGTDSAVHMTSSLPNN